MNQQKKFDSKQQQESSAELQATQNTVQEFATVEELLRHESAGITVPKGIAERLQKSTADFPNPSRSWWQRFLGK